MALFCPLKLVKLKLFCKYVLYTTSSGPALPLRSLALRDPGLNLSLLPTLQVTENWQDCLLEHFIETVGPSWLTFQPCVSGSVGASRTVQARLEQGSLLSSFRETSSISLAFLAQVLPIYPLTPQLPPPSQVGDSVHSLTWRSHDTLEATISSLPSSSLGPVLLSTLLDGKVVASARLLPQNSKYSPTPVSSFFTPSPLPGPC